MMVVGFVIGVVTTALLAWIHWTMRKSRLPPKDLPGDW